jgi:hypothetical protein
VTTPQLVCYNGKLIQPTYGYGLCKCGCGGKTRIFPNNDTTHGYVAGEPVSFIKGHTPRIQGADYEIRECGYQTPCWLWLKLASPEGYGRITVDGKHRRATHAYYRHYVGEFPDDQHLDHLCRVHSCVNPEHLEPVPPGVNVRRGAKCLYTEDDIKRMMEMRKTGMLYKDIARHFGAATEYIQAICYGKRWQGIVGAAELPKKTTRVTNQQIEKMIEMRARDLSAADIGDALNINHWRVYPILRRKNLGRKFTGRHARIKSEPGVGR